MESFPAPIKILLAELKVLDPSLHPEIEPGGVKAGNWWIDLTGKERITIEWRPGLGFGLSVGDAKGYGEGPDEIFRSPARTARRVMQLIDPRPNFGSTGLRAIRELYDVTQDQIATRLKKGQAAISRLETRRDFKVETIGQYVRALGGRMEIRAVFPDGQLPIYKTETPRRRRKSSKFRP